MTLQQTARHTLFHYLVAIALIFFASILRIWPLQALGTSLVWITYYPAVMIIAIIGGFQLGIFSTGLACLAALFLLPILVGQPFISFSADRLGLLVFAINCSMISGVAEAMLRAQKRTLDIQEQLRSASLYSRSLIEASLDPMVTINLEGKITDVNKASETATGKKRTELIGTDFSDYFTEPDKAREAYQRAFANGYITDYPLSLRHQDGHAIDVLYNASVYYNENGKILGVFAAARDITEYKQIESALQANEQRLELAISSGQIGIWDLDLINHTAYRSLEHDCIFGYESLLPKWTFEMFLEHILPDDRSEVNRIFYEAIENKTDWSFECRIRRIDGEVRWIWAHGKHQPDKHGVMRRMIGTVQDITKRKTAEANLLRVNRALNLLSKCNKVLIHAEDEQELLTKICQLSVETGGYLMAWVGYAEHDAAKSVTSVAQSGFEEGYLNSINVTWADSERGQGPTGSAIRNGVTVVNQNCLTNPKMAPWREAAIKRGYQSSIALPLASKNHILGALTIYSAEPFAFGQEEVGLLEELASDLAYGIQTLRARIEHDAAENQLKFLAHHDPLTSLPNRLLLRDRFDQAASFAIREQSAVAVLFLDLDNFKQINDSLGHGYGDSLLTHVVIRLQACIRETDTISRQGGDEFVILLTNLYDVSSIETIAKNIVEAFVEPICVDEYNLNTSFSIGISLFPWDGKEFDELLKKADMALYQAKDAGRNTYRFFTQQMNTDALENIKLESQLRNAIKQQEFVLHYQPQIETDSKRIIGAEALVRWQHPVLGVIPPGKFIPLAERSGLIIPLGEWVLNEACRQAQAWRDANHPYLVIAVNLSALQFKRGNIIDTVNRALERSGLPPAQLELELTESILLQDIDMVVKTLHRLKEIGIKLSIDDFGTGYSSLSYLKRLSVDKLKIDQSFVRDMVGDIENAEIVKAIIQLGKILKLTTIAEGVENDAQLELLKNYGCSEIQGYLISRPLPATEFSAFYKQSSTDWP